MPPRSRPKFILFTAVLLLIVSLACNPPFGIGVDMSGDSPARATQNAAALATPTFTPSPTFTPLPTFTPTNTPEPTPTATQVVPPTNTPTPAPTPTNTPTNTPIPPQIPGGVTAPGGSAPVHLVPSASLNQGNVLVNGDFEAEWPDWKGNAPGWETFDNGDAHYGWYKEGWNEMIYDGQQAQLIEIVSDGGQEDRVAGIYQTVQVVPGAQYELIVHGIIRSDEGGNKASGFGYSMQYGLDFTGGDDWEVVTDWVEMPFPEFPREDPDATIDYYFGTFKTTFVASGDTLTLYLRGYDKWPDFREGNFTLDGLSLKATGLRQAAAPASPVG